MVALEPVRASRRGRRARTTSRRRSRATGCRRAAREAAAEDPRRRAAASSSRSGTSRSSHVRRKETPAIDRRRRRRPDGAPPRPRARTPRARPAAARGSTAGLTVFGGVHARRQPRRELAVQPVREDRAEHGDADRAADLPEEERARRRDAHVPVVDRVLHREHEHLHDRAEPEAEHDHRRATCTAVVEWMSSRESSTMPTVITAVPTTGNGL